MPVPVVSNLKDILADAVCVLQWKVSLIHTLMIDLYLDIKWPHQQMSVQQLHLFLKFTSLLFSLSHYFFTVLEPPLLTRAWRRCSLDLQLGDACWMLFLFFVTADHSDSWEPRCSLRYQVRGRLKSHSFNGHKGWERGIKLLLLTHTSGMLFLSLSLSLSFFLLLKANWFTAAAEFGWVSLPLPHLWYSLRLSHVSSLPGLAEWLNDSVT